MNPYYQELAENLYLNDHHGVLTPEEVAARWAEWVAYVHDAHVLTRDIHKALPDDQKRGYRVRVWGTVGGLQVSTTGNAAKAYRAILKRYQDIAKSRARQLRKEAGWSGRNYLTDPNGRRTNPSGSGYSQFTVPREAYNLGPWDGVLTDETKFTK